MQSQGLSVAMLSFATGTQLCQCIISLIPPVHAGIAANDTPTAFRHDDGRLHWWQILHFSVSVRRPRKLSGTGVSFVSSKIRSIFLVSMATSPARSPTASAQLRVLPSLLRSIGCTALPLDSPSQDGAPRHTLLSEEGEWDDKWQGGALLGP